MSINPALKLLYKIIFKKKYQEFKYKKKSENRIKYYNSKIYEKIVNIENSRPNLMSPAL